MLVEQVGRLGFFFFFLPSRFRGGSFENLVFVTCSLGGKNVAISWPDRGSRAGWNPCIPEAGAPINHCLFLSGKHGPVWEKGGSLAGAAHQLPLMQGTPRLRGVPALQPGSGSGWCQPHGEKLRGGSGWRAVTKSRPNALLMTPGFRAL